MKVRDLNRMRLDDGWIQVAQKGSQERVMILSLTNSHEVEALRQQAAQKMQAEQGGLGRTIQTGDIGLS